MVHTIESAPVLKEFGGTGMRMASRSIDIGSAHSSREKGLRWGWVFSLWSATHTGFLKWLLVIGTVGLPLNSHAVNPVQINDHDLRLALQWSIHCMSNVQNPQDRYIPYFDCYVLQNPPYMLYNAYYSVPVNAAKILQALLNTEAVTGLQVEPLVIERYRQVVFDSFSPVPGVCAAPDAVGAPYNTYWTINGHAMRALAALVKYRNDATAGKLMEEGIANLKTYFVDAGYSWAAFREHFDLPATGGILGQGWPQGSVAYGADSTCVLAFLEYYQATGYAPSLEMCQIYANNLMSRKFPEDGSLPASTFFMLGPTREMNALARVALEIGDATMMARARARYENGLQIVRSSTGWVPENTRSQSDTGEVNTTGELAEAAMIFGDWGWTEYYEDAERYTRAHLLPSQLLDNSFGAAHSDLNDSKNNLKERTKGAFGFPAPYGHIATKNSRHQGAFHMDIVAGGALSLSEVVKHTYKFQQGNHYLLMLFDQDNSQIYVKSPYPTGNAVEVTLRVGGDLHVRIPSWVNRDTLTISGLENSPGKQYEGLFLVLPDLPVGDTFSIQMDIPFRMETETINDRQITTLWRGDSVAAMNQMECPLPFFDEIFIPSTIDGWRIYQ